MLRSLANASLLVGLALPGGSALAAPPVPAPLDEPAPPLPPPDHARLRTYHGDPLILPRLDVSALGGVDDRGAANGFVLVEGRLGGTFAFGVGASNEVLDEGPTLTWGWRLFSYQHYWNMDIVLRTPVLDLPAGLAFGVGGDMSPLYDGRIAVRVRGLIDPGGFSGQLGVVVRAL